MLDAYWLLPLVSEVVEFEGASVVVSHASPFAFDGEESGENARLVSLSDVQLGALLSLLSLARHKSNWNMNYIRSGQLNLFIVPDNPRGLRWSQFPEHLEQGIITHDNLDGELDGLLSERVDLFVSELQEQLMVDVRPELNAMVAAQNEMSDDLDAIRISLQEIAANIEAENNSERLEEIANTIGLLVALL